MSTGCKLSFKSGGAVCAKQQNLVSTGSVKLQKGNALVPCSVFYLSQVLTGVLLICLSLAAYPFTGE
jgi:hypothetical protein